MNMKLIALSALAALMTAGCGGGSSDSSSGAGTSNPPVVNPTPTPTPSKLAAYVGTWAAACDGRELPSVTVTETPGVKDSIDFEVKSEYFKNTGCTGAIVGTETLTAKFTATYVGTADAGIVFTAGSASVPSKVDLITLRAPAHTMKIEGPGVVRTIKNGQAQWCMDFGGGNSSCVYDEGAIAAQGPISGGMHATGNKMYTLVPSGSIYGVDEAYTKR